jgi:hypothetical protein
MEIGFILVGLIILALAAVGWVCCAAAGRGDEILGRFFPGINEGGDA